MKDIFKKEIFRVFSDKKMIFSLFILPAILMFGIYGLMGMLMDNMVSDVEEHISTVYVQNAPEGFEELAAQTGYDKLANINYLAADTSAEKVQELKDGVLNGGVDLLVIFDKEFLAKAQAYAQYNTANPANALAWVAETKTQSFTAPETDFVAVRNGLTGDRIAAASLKISNFAQIRVSVEATKADRLVVSNDSGASLIYMLADSEKDGDVYTVFCGGLPATEYDTVWTAALADAEGTTYAAVKYSVNSYVAAKCGSDDALLAELVKAMYNYGVSADNYITVKAAADAVTDGGLTGEEEGNGESGSYNDLFG